MEKSRFFNASLRTRLCVGVVAIVLTTTAGLTSGALHFVKRSAQQSIASEQFERVSSIAAAVDQKFVSRRLLLKTFSDSVRAQEFASGAELQGFLMKHHASLKESFDNVSFLDMRGDLVANLNGAQQIGRVNIKDRLYFIETVSTKAGVISQPYRNRVNGHAQVAVTQPVLDARGEVVYVMSGSINLKDDNFLGELADIRFGQSGYMFITNTDGIVIDHPRKARILNDRNAEGGQNPAAERAIDGFEGTTEAMNRMGVYDLYAFKRTRQTNWVIGAIYPRVEAFADLERIESLAWGGAIVLTLLSGGLALLVLQFQLAPLLRLQTRMQFSRATTAYIPLEKELTRGEIGDLARTFDSLMLERHVAQERLQASENYLREVLAHAGDAFVSIDHTDAVTEWNRQAELTFGWSREEAIGCSLGSLIALPAMREMYERGMRSCVSTGADTPINKRIEVNALHRDGHHIPVELTVAAVQVGDHYVANAFIRDISARKSADAKLASNERFLRDVTDNLPAVVAYFTRDQVCMFCNKAGLSMGKKSVADVGSMTMRDALPQVVYEQHVPYLERVLAGQASRFEGTYPRNGSEGHFQCHLVPDLRQGAVEGFFVMTFDITRQKLAEQDRAKGEERIRTITDNLPVLISYVDRDERYRFVNRTLHDWTGLDPQDVIGLTVRETIGESAYAERAPAFQRVLAGESVTLESDGMQRDPERIVKTLFVPDRLADGSIVGIYGLSTDVTETRQMERQLKELARVDVLTHLPNRLAFNEALPVALARARRTGDALALMFLDIDRFKAINDSLGHAGGDAVLVEFSRRLLASVRTTDTVARLAGDEFVVILENLGSREVVSLVADKIVAQVSDPSYRVQQDCLEVTTSIGIAYLSPHGSVTPAVLLARADTALYAAKANGRNGYHFDDQDDSLVFTGLEKSPITC